MGSATPAPSRSRLAVSPHPARRPERHVGVRASPARSRPPRESRPTTPRPAPRARCLGPTATDRTATRAQRRGSRASRPMSGGTVNFSPAIAPGGSTYFSLEAPPSAAAIKVGTPTTTPGGTTKLPPAFGRNGAIQGLRRHTSAFQNVISNPHPPISRDLLHRGDRVPQPPPGRCRQEPRRSVLGSNQSAQPPGRNRPGQDHGDHEYRVDHLRHPYLPHVPQTAPVHGPPRL